MDRSWWRVLTKCGPLEKGMANQFSILALRIPWTVWKEYWSDCHFLLQCMKVKSQSEVTQSCPTLSGLMDCRPPGSSIHGILQARILEWVAISSSHAWKWKVKVKSLSRVRLLVASWTAAYQAPPSIGFSRQEFWSAHQGCQVQFRTSRRNVGSLWRCSSGQGPHIAMIHPSSLSHSLPSFLISLSLSFYFLYFPA